VTGVSLMANIPHQTVKVALPRIEKPSYQVLTTREEVVRFLGSEVIDMRKYILVVVSRGMCPTGGYKITINRLVRDGHNVHVHLLFSEPMADDFVTMVITYPQDIVAVERKYFSGNTVFQFLNHKGNELARRSIAFG